MSPRRPAILALLVAACAPDLDYRLYDPRQGDAAVADGEGEDAAIEEDLAEPEDMTVGDLRGADLRGRDLSVARDLAARKDLSVARDLAVTPCPPPVLLIGVESTQSGVKTRIERYSLGRFGVQTRCSPLLGGGFLPQQMTAVAWIPDAGIAFAGPDGVGLLDPATDSILWSQPVNEFNPRAVDLFPLVDPGAGEQIVAAAFAVNGESNIRVVYGFKADGAAHKFGSQPKWEMNSTSVLVLGLGVTSMTPSPYDPGYVLYIKSSGSSTAAAEEANPFTAMKPADPFVLHPAGGLLKTIHAFDGRYPASLKRLAWAGESNSMGALYYLTDTAGGSRRNPSGPTACTAATCKYLHAVGDPVETTGLLALCEVASGSRQVVRYQVTRPGDCATLTSAALPSRFTYLGLVLR